MQNTSEIKVSIAALHHTKVLKYTFCRAFLSWWIAANNPFNMKHLTLWVNQINHSGVIYRILATLCVSDKSTQYATIGLACQCFHTDLPWELLCETMLTEAVPRNKENKYTILYAILSYHIIYFILISHHYNRFDFCYRSLSVSKAYVVY